MTGETDGGKDTVGVEQIEVPENFSNPAFRGAWRKGAEAAVRGKPRSACPYDRDNYGQQGVTFSRAFWRRWQEGYKHTRKGTMPTDGHTAELYRCTECGAEVPQSEPAGRGMMNRQVPCGDTLGGHNWVLED